MIIHGIELEFDITEMDTLKAFDTGLSAVAKVRDELDKNQTITAYERIEGLMEAIRKFFDILFGKGTGEEVCGKTNARKHMEAYKALIVEKERQQKEYGELCASVPVQNVIPDATETQPASTVQNVIEGAFHESSE